MGAFFTDGGEASVDDRLIEGSMAEVGGDVPDTDPIFEEVRGITMTQRIDTLLINSVLERSPTGFTRSLTVKSKSYVS